jgi:AcrR family transcriptional regulator
MSATVDEICRVAGSSRATFYLHFKSKHALALALLALGLPDSSVWAEVESLLADGGDELRERLQAWLSDRFDAWAADAGASRALLRGATLKADLETRLLELAEGRVDHLSRYLETVSDPARARVRDHMLVLEVMTQHALMNASKSRLPIARENLLAALVDMWSCALSASFKPTELKGATGDLPVS